jgi:sulfofructose kinase
MKRVLCVGHAVQDYVFRVPQLPQRAEKYRASAFETVGGGPAATAAVAIVRLGGAARLAARVGDDAIAATIEAELQAYGVDCAGLRRFRGRQSSLSAVFVDDAGERMIVNHTDRAMPTDPAWLDELTLDDVDAVLADTRWPEGAGCALARARSTRRPAVLDADVPVPRSTELLAAATHIAFSEPGLREHAPHDDPELALREVALRLRCWCAVTLGAAGVLFADGRAAAPGSQLRVERSPAFAVRAVDTLGAGDVWHGAFALALAEGAAEGAAVRAASAAAALKVTRPGGRAGVPTRLERDRLLENA